MIDVVIIGDLHLHNFQRWGRQKIDGLNYRATMTLASLRSELDYITQSNGTAVDIVFAGDVFDVSKPEPVLIATLMEMLGSYYKSKFYLMTGNHDVGSSGKDDHSLAPFKHGPSNIVVVDKPMHLNDKILMHPWLVSGSLKDSIQEHRAATTTTVIAHGFVEPQPFGLESNSDLTDIPDLNVIAGHVHTTAMERKNGRVLISIGAFGPTAFGDDGGCYVLGYKSGVFEPMTAGLRVRFDDTSLSFYKSMDDRLENDTPEVSAFNAMTFYRIIIPEVDRMPVAKEMAKALMRRGCGGVTIKLEKKHRDEQEKSGPKRHSNTDEVIQNELDSYCSELKLADYTRLRIQEAIVECVKKTT